MNYLYTAAGREYLEEHYDRLRKSTYEVAEELGVYPNCIRRALRHHGITIRNRSEARANALKTGRARHPTTGSSRSDETRRRISDSLRENRDSLREIEDS